MKLKLLCDGLTLFDSTNDIYKATQIKLTEQVNTTNTLTFTLPVFNPNYSKPQELTSLIELYRDDGLVFEGRLLYTDDNILGTRTFTCEGSLAYLLDSIQRPKEYHNTSVSQYLQDKIAQHNEGVEKSKQFSLGAVTVTNSTDNVYRIDNDYSNTLNVIQEKLVNRLGGYLRVRKVNDIRYLDYIEKYEEISEQVIEFQKNILDLSQRISAENVITALIPLGAKDETTELPLTISSVNDGKDYIVDETAVSLFGYIYGKNNWDDVTEPNNLKTKGIEFLKENIKKSVSITVNAVDLSMLFADIDKLNLGMSVKVLSKPHKLDKYFVIKKKETDFLAPENSSITLDTIIKTNTDQVSSSDRVIDEVKKIPNNINSVIKSQTDLITGGKGGNIVYGFNSQGKPEELYFLDTETIDTAVNIIRVNKNGIGFSNRGINGPYESAWTIDGVFNAKFIQAGMFVASNGKFSINFDTGKAVFKDGEFTGKVTATSGEFKGKVTATSGEFTGDIYASNGKIGSLVINSEGFSFNGIRNVMWYGDSTPRRARVEQVIQVPNSVDGAGFRVLAVLVDSANNPISDEVYSEIYADGFFTTGMVDCYSLTYFEISQNSDKRLKENIVDIDDRLVNVWKDLQQCQFEFNDIIKSDDKKHFGLIAQDVISTFEKHGLDYRDYAFVGERYNPKDKNTYYQLDYSYYHMMTAKVLKYALEKIEKLEKGANT